ncbi:MAG TPA: sigma factor [Gemmatimonadaceae bacterium]|nr:sigma factor [Gemmatimonadaceae bacterium]
MSSTLPLPRPASLADDASHVIDPTVRAAQRGDETAFAALYDTHALRIHALCLGLAGDRGAAAELVQDVFVRAWEKLASFRGESAFGTWLHRLAVNVVLESARSRRRRSLRVQIAADLRIGESRDGGVDVDAPIPGAEPGVAMDISCR